MTETTQPRELPAWVKDHVTRYLATDGDDGYLWDASGGGGRGMVPTLLLTTVGRKSGRVLTLPLIFGRSGAALPAWYLNLEANPQVRLQAEKFAAHAHTADAAERAALWPMMVKVYGPYADYQKKTDRQIPVVVLRRV